MVDSKEDFLKALDNPKNCILVDNSDKFETNNIRYEQRALAKEYIEAEQKYHDSEIRFNK